MPCWGSLSSRVECLLGVTEPQGHGWNDWGSLSPRVMGEMTVGSLEGGVTHPYDTGSSALELWRVSLLQMRVLS